jgi:hypothetical protein
VIGIYPIVTGFMQVIAMSMYIADVHVSCLNFTFASLVHRRTFSFRGI